MRSMKASSPPTSTSPQQRRFSLFSVTRNVSLLPIDVSRCSPARILVRCLVIARPTSYGGQPMTLTLNLPPSVEATLKQCAAQAGQAVDAYVEQLVQKAVAPG